MNGNELSVGVAGTPYSSLAGVFIILKPGVDGIGVGVANKRRDGVRIGAYPTGASRIRYLPIMAAAAAATIERDTHR